MARRVCAQPGCPQFQPCTTHVRPNAHQRGYGTAHRKTRAAWVERVQAGVVKCWRCGQVIAPGEPFDLGHDDVDRSITRGPEHIACNRSAAGRVSQDRYRQ